MCESKDLIVFEYYHFGKDCDIASSSTRNYFAISQPKATERSMHPCKQAAATTLP